jgi:uncharacterized protein (DUF1330 family)
MSTQLQPQKSRPWKIGLYDSSGERETNESEFLVKLEDKMPAYVVVDLDVIDKETYEIYKKMVPETVAQYGGKYIVRGGNVETLEGTWAPQRLVILEFPSIEKAKAWSDSAEYAKPKALRQACARSQIILVEGV